MAGRLAGDWDMERQRVTFTRGSQPVPSLDDLRTARGIRRRRAASTLTTHDDPWPQHQKLGWWLPHTVYELHLVDEHQFKVGVSRGTAKGRRLGVLTAGREAVLVDRIEVTNRFVAEMVEVDVLTLVEPWHCLGDPWYPQSGYTERWSATGPTVDLGGVRRALL